MPRLPWKDLLSHLRKRWKVCPGAVWSLLLVILAFETNAAHGQTVIDYPNGFADSTGQIWLENSTTLYGSSIQLTQSGETGLDNNAWFESPVNVQAFTTTFTFANTCPADCGEGFGFMIISVSNPSSAGYTFSAANGPQFSWSQCGGTGNTDCATINSVLVKFDLYDVQKGSPGANFTGFYSGGIYPQPPNSPEYDMAPSGINMESGDLMRATLWYDGKNLTEIVTDTQTGATFTNSYIADIPSLVGGNTAYVGFGGSTGADSVAQNLLSWTYTVEASGQASIPILNPAAGTFVGPQSVTLSTASPGSVICYNTSGSPASNGSNGCNTGTLYAGPVVVSSSETLYAVAGGAGHSDSAAVSSNYVIQNSVMAPIFSPVAGVYTSPQTVSISDIVSNATVFYTTDGTTPTASSTKYTGPIDVAKSEALKAIAIASGNASSAVTTAAYTINLPTSVATPEFSPPAGTYTSAQSINISDANNGAVIYYTMDGTAPSSSSTKYSGPITVGATETLQAVAIEAGEITSAIASATYAINLESDVAVPIFSPGGGTYTSPQSVSISDATQGAAVYYTVNGTTPTSSSTLYVGPVAVASTETLKAIAVAAGENNSAIAAASYNISPEAMVPTPIFFPASGTYNSPQVVIISDSMRGATIYYTMNGTAPTTSSPVYTGPITISQTETLDAIAVAAGDINSTVGSAAYTITSLPVVSTPIFSPPPGTYTTAQSVTISDGTTNATVYYTTDGTVPTSSSTVYSRPIAVNSTEMLEAIAVATDETNSAVVSAEYTIAAAMPVVSTPIFSPPAGNYGSGQSVSIADSTSGATIYYTTDGTTPTAISSNAYAGPVSVNSTETLKAIAVATGYTSSMVATASYTITVPASFTLNAAPDSLTVDSNGQGSVTLTVTPKNGFDTSVSFECSGLPAGASCSFSPSTVTPSTGAVSTQCSISVVAQSSSMRRGSRPLLPFAAMSLTVGLFNIRRRKRWNACLSILVAFAGLVVLAGCGGGSTGSTAASPTPAATTSIVTVAGTSGSIHQTATIALTIN